MTKSEYTNIRVERNKIRDQFNKETSFLKASKLKKQIKELDKILQKYEKTTLVG